jgi:hypothetical protein
MSKQYVEKLDKSKYKRPKSTYTEKLSKNEIMSKLEDYKKEDITKIPLGIHVRYFVIDENGQKFFRMGGQLTKNDGMPKYVILSNGKNSWSVQANSSTIFFKKMTINEIKQEYEDKLLDKDKKIKQLMTLIKQLKKTYNIA